jgi:hypothetical protein
VASIEPDHTRYRMTIPGPADEPWSPVGPDIEPTADEGRPEHDHAIGPEREAGNV